MLRDDTRRVSYPWCMVLEVASLLGLPAIRLACWASLLGFPATQGLPRRLVCLDSALSVHARYFPATFYSPTLCPFFNAFCSCLCFCFFLFFFSCRPQLRREPSVLEHF